MPRTSRAVIRGRVVIRPWRIGLLIDTADADAVEKAIESLSDVWGGYFLPILDRNAPLGDIREAGRLFDLDGLYAETPAPELEELLRVPGYCWHGAGEWGPFSATAAPLRKGLLQVSSLAERRPCDSTRTVGEPLGLLQVALSGAAQETKALLRPSLSYVDPLPEGLFVIREDEPRDVAWYWNCRSLGGSAFPVVARRSPLNEEGVAALLRERAAPPTGREGLSDEGGTIDVWGWAEMSMSARAELESCASSVGLALTPRDRADALTGAWFPGFEPAVSRSFRVEVDAGSPFFSVELPRLPLLDPSGYFVGVVAAEIIVHGDQGLDPRLTAALPPHRRHAGLLERAFVHGVDHARVSPEGPVLAVQAGADEVSVPLAFNLDVMRVLFDDDGVRVSQSDDGRFQSRTAEMLGGSTSGALTQPGVRAAVEVAASKNRGVTLQEIQARIEARRGEWPDPLLVGSVTPREYAAAETRKMLASGLFVPMLDTQCSYCRVVSRVHPNDLAATVRCDFCGREFNLALSLALGKPVWRYRLAGHLAVEKVRAMMPALAAISVLSQLRNVEGPRLSHVLGLEVTLPGSRPVEVDVAAILHEDDWTVVLGEVKNQNRIDERDLRGLHQLQSALRAKDVRCVLLFATLKESFSPQEKSAIREIAEEGAESVETPSGALLPLLPLLLTAPDLSVPWGSRSHPWHWGERGSGVLGAAIDSCRRNLGLAAFSFANQESDRRVLLTWDDSSGEASENAGG